MKKVLVLGVGAAQVDLLRALCGRYEIHACSNAAQGPGLALVDKYAAIDIADKHAVLQYCVEHAIDWLYSVGSDLAMPTACWVSEQLQLPHLVTAWTASTCKDKVALRIALREMPGAVRFQAVASPDEDVHMPFPVMVKPADSQGQRGVALAHTLESCRERIIAALPYSASGRVILEEVIDGPEISAHAFVVDGKVRWICCSDRITWPGVSGGIIHKHIVPAALNSTVKEKTHGLVREIVARLAIRQGPVYFQIKVQAGEPRLIEVTPRLDGCHMWRLLLAATGTDLLSATIAALQGEAYTLGSDACTLGIWTLAFFCAPPGTPMDRQAFVVDEEAMCIEWYYSDGQPVARVNGVMEKCGYQIYRKELGT